MEKQNHFAAVILVAALLIDYFYLHKAINFWQWCGAGLTLLAIYLGSIKR